MGATGAGVRLTGAAPPGSGYIFAGDSAGIVINGFKPGDLNPYDFSQLPNGAVGVTANDFPASGSATLAAGATVNLLHVSYHIDANAPVGEVKLTFTGGSNLNQVTDPDLNPIP